jgi:putative ATP-dependent endonuclease of OLD family
MYLKSFTVKNYRKFRDKNNKVYFVEPRQVESTNKKDDVSDSVIAPSTTLIIGKNNTGKTTIVNALKLICDNKQPKSADFNIQYLNELFSKYQHVGIEHKSLPELSFTVTAKVNTSNHDLMTNLDDFVTLIKDKDISADALIDVLIHIKIVVAEESAFIDAVKDMVEHVKNVGLEKVEAIELFYQLLDKKSDFLMLNGDKNLFKIQFFNSDRQEAKKFTLKDLINLKEIKANRHLKEGCLREVFNRIIKFQFDNNKTDKDQLESEIKIINTALTGVIENKNSNISDVLQQIETTEHVDLALKGNVSYDSIIRDLIKYNFSDNDDYIPEGQFGLGYINLLNIIGEIIHYVDSYQNGSHNSQINLLFIEEPEVFMHPQMQEFFINRIDNAVKKALGIANEDLDDKKVLNCQIAITTHSSHIVNSKIHSSKSFNNINYLTVIDKATSVVKLSDEVVAGKDGLNSDNLKFIKKHIKYKVSELFFSDAVIFVEGPTEEALLQFYLDQNKVLKNHYISVFNINGAHGKVYFPLIKALKVPCLIITDLDIKRQRCEKNIKHKKTDNDCKACSHKKNIEDTDIILEQVEYKQIESLKGLLTTNPTIKEFNQVILKKDNNDFDKLDDIDYFSDLNLYVVFQKNKIENYHATSLEEAFILSNSENNILNIVLDKCKSKVYKSIVGVGDEIDKSKLILNSYKLQQKLSDSKSDFSNELLYQCIIHDENELPELPNYINDGFEWLIKELSPRPIQIKVASDD